MDRRVVVGIHGADLGNARPNGDGLEVDEDSAMRWLAVLDRDENCQALQMDRGEDGVVSVVDDDG